MHDNCQKCGRRTDKSFRLCRDCHSNAHQSGGFFGQVLEGETGRAIERTPIQVIIIIGLFFIAFFNFMNPDGNKTLAVVLAGVAIFWIYVRSKKKISIRTSNMKVLIISLLIVGGAIYFSQNPLTFQVESKSQSQPIILSGDIYMDIYNKVEPGMKKEEVAAVMSRFPNSIKVEKGELVWTVTTYGSQKTLSILFYSNIQQVTSVQIKEGQSTLKSKRIGEK